MFLNVIIHYFLTIHNGQNGQKNVIFGLLEFSSK